MKISLVGASVRAAACSLLRYTDLSERQMLLFDMFGDADLPITFPHHSIMPLRTPEESFPLQILNVDEIALTGGTEFWDELLRQANTENLISSTNFEAIQRLRDPIWLRDFCNRHLIGFPQSSFDLAEIESSRVLQKPLCHCGGSNIEIVNNTNEDADCGRNFFQEFIKGKPYGATFVCNGGNVELFGVCEQLFAEQSEGPSFQYAGSTGPIELDAKMTRELESIGQKIVDETGFQGPFGIDFVLQDNTKRIWVIEVNPRYTASMEIHEILQRRSVFASVLNLEAVDEDQSNQRESQKLCKLFAYNQTGEPIEISSDFTSTALSSNEKFFKDETRSVGMADIPHPQTVIQPNHPIFTILVRAKNNDSAIAKARMFQKIILRENVLN